ncbi:hypothetical protein OIV83_000256 [Microbotryomycetes sp. JL201]|nr:hypothetical protein OIV83_000256 [Microbotryomycetes sp. JL201]
MPSPGKLMKALYVDREHRTLVLSEIPKPENGEVLIKNVIDWKIPYYMPPYEAVEGNDVAGTVESVGPGVSRFSKGDRVAAFTPMRTANKYGAYAEYTVSKEPTTFPIRDNTTFENAAALPLAYATAAIGLYKRLGLPTPDEPATDKTPILVYGAATTVGVYVTQLAKKSGLYVIGVAGKSCKHAEQYGCDKIIDYRKKSNEELVDEIKKAGDGKIKHVYDCVSENGTMDIIVDVLKENGGTFTYVLTYDDKTLASLPNNVKPVRTLVATAHQNEADFVQEYFYKVSKWIDKGEFKAQKTTLIPEGLVGVAEGLRRLQDGEAHAEKFIYRVSETPESAVQK